MSLRDRFAAAIRKVNGYLDAAERALETASARAINADVTHAQAEHDAQLLREIRASLVGITEEQLATATDVVELYVTEAEKSLEDYLADATLQNAKPARVDPPNPKGVDDYRSQAIVWRVSGLDLQHPQNWTERRDSQSLLAVIRKLGSLERCTWAEIERNSDHSHDWEDTSEWEPSSQDRLLELGLDDQAGWYQLHLDKMGRLFGFRDGRVFNVVWWDPEHEVYKTKQKVKSQR